MRFDGYHMILVLILQIPPILLMFYRSKKIRTDVSLFIVLNFEVLVY